MKDLIDLDHARKAMAEGRGAGVKVAVIDSGIETTHPQLKGLELVDDLAVEGDGRKLQVVHGKGHDVYGHGTAVAAVLRILAPEARIGSIRALGGPYNTSRTVIIERAVQEALDRGYQILNCSFGCGVQSQVLQYKSWVDQAYLQGVHIVAACNNLDFTQQEWPAYFPSVISVNMARTGDEDVFYYSRGTMIEFAAKGVNVKLPWSDGKQKIVSGSSYATPRLAALVARLMSRYPELGPLATKAILHRLAIPWSKKVAAANV